MISWFKTKLSSKTTVEANNIMLDKDGRIRPRPGMVTVLKKELHTSDKWFCISDYLSSTVGLYTGCLLNIDGTYYKIVRHDKKRGKFWAKEWVTTWEAKK